LKFLFVYLHYHIIVVRDFYLLYIPGVPGVPKRREELIVWCNQNRDVSNILSFFV